MTRSIYMLGFLTMALVFGCATQSFGQVRSIFPPFIEKSKKPPETQEDKGRTNSVSKSKLGNKKKAKARTSIFPFDLPTNDPPDEIPGRVAKQKPDNVENTNVPQKPVTPVKPSETGNAAPPNTGVAAQPKSATPEGVFRATVVAKNGQKLVWTLVVDKNKNVGCFVNIGNRQVALKGKCSNANGTCVIAVQNGGVQFAGNVNWQNADCFVLTGGQTNYTYYRVPNHCPQGGPK